MRSYNTTTDLQNMPPIEPNTVKKVSFHINTFWYHVRILGDTGIDQKGNRWFLKGEKLYSEFSYHIVDLKKLKTA